MAGAALECTAHHQSPREKQGGTHMLGRLMTATLVLLAVGTPALAQRDNLQVFRDVQQQVLRYPHFTIFDSVNARIDSGVVILTGKVTMPYKRTVSTCCPSRASTTTCATRSRGRSTATLRSRATGRW
jgi:hypothetical protein